eukprot:g2251.t1
MNLAAAPARNPRPAAAASAATTTSGSTGTTTDRSAAAALPSRRRRRRAEGSSTGEPAAAQEGMLNVDGTNLGIGIGIGPDLGGAKTSSSGGIGSLLEPTTKTPIFGFAGVATDGLRGVFSVGSGVGGRHRTAAPPPAESRLGGGGVRSVEVVMMGGWHPAAEPDDDESDDTHHDSWRRMRVEELIKDPFLTPGRINEIMDPNNIQRHQYNTNPDSSYGAVFQLDTLVDVIPGLIYPAWLEVARALNQNAPTLHTVERGYGMTPEQMFLREFNWRLTQEELEGGLEVYDRTILRQALKYEPTETHGSRRWLETLRRIPMPTAVLSRLPSAVVDKVLEKTELAGYFASQHRVTGEDEPFDDYRGYMLAALKVQRSTMKCCAFDCRQEGMIKAHDADLRGVCRIGVQAAWELRLSDLSVENFDDMNVINFRQIFADREFEPGMLQLELEPEAAPMRQTEVATKVDTRWPDEEEEPEPWAEGGGGGGDDRRGGGGGGGGGGLRRRW